MLIPCMSYAADAGVFNDIQTRFENAVSGKSNAIQNAANWLFWTLATISLDWNITCIQERRHF